jgi:hypothetical protein
LIFGPFYSKVNPRAKALGPNQNKNAQIQLVKLSKQKVFVKEKNVSDKKLGLVINTFDKNTLFHITKRLQRATNYFKKLYIISLRVKASLFVLSPEIEDRDEVKVGNWAKHKKTFFWCIKNVSYKCFFY